MKPSNRTLESKKDDSKAKAKENIGNDEEGENQGFGNWLRSSDGIEMMRLFVIANSLLVFITMGWPNMQHVYSIIKDYVMDDEV